MTESEDILRAVDENQQMRIQEERKSNPSIDSNQQNENSEKIDELPKEETNINNPIIYL